MGRPGTALVSDTSLLVQSTFTNTVSVSRSKCCTFSCSTDLFLQKRSTKKCSYALFHTRFSDIGRWSENHARHTKALLLRQRQTGAKGDTDTNDVKLIQFSSSDKRPVVRLLKCTLHVFLCSKVKDDRQSRLI